MSERAPSTPPPSQEEYRAIGRRRLQSEQPAYKAKQEQVEGARLELADAEAEGDALAIERAELKLDIANKELELFDVSHDATGTWRSDKFGKDLEQPFKQLFEAESGEQKIPPSEHFLFIVNMGELDRLNKEGGHGGGDKGLELTAVGIEEVLKRHLRQSESGDWGEVFDLYRFTGNEFSINIKTGVSGDQAHAIRTAIEAMTVFKNKEHNPTADTDPEAPPITARYINLEQVRHAMPETAASGEKPERKAVQVAKDLLLTLIEEEKIVARVERLQEKFTALGDAKAEQFFNDYLKKSLSGLEFQWDSQQRQIKTFEDAKVVIEAIPKDELGRWKFLHQAAFEASVKQLNQFYTEHTATAERIAKAGLEIAKAEFSRQKERLRQDGGEFEARSSHPELGEEVQSGALEVAPSAEFTYPDRETATRGLRVVGAQRQKVVEAYKVFETDTAHAINDREKLMKSELAHKRETIAMNLELSKRDRATGLELKPQMYRAVQDAFRSGKSVANIGIDMAFLKYYDRMGGAKTGDLAILKAAEIFDRACLSKAEGGPGIFDAFADRGVKAEVFRPGGDEFNIVVTGEFKDNPAALEEAISNLKIWLLQEAQQTGGIPPQEGAKAEYHATQLNVGLGSEAFASFEEGLKKCEERGIGLELPEDLVPGTEEEMKRNKLAERLFEVADQALEIQKSYQRFQYLGAMGKNVIRLAKLAQQEAGNAELVETLQAAKEQYKQLLSFSQKSLGEGSSERMTVLTGIRLETDPNSPNAGELVLDLEHDVSQNPERDRQENEELLNFIIERAGREVAHKRMEGQEASARIALVAQIQFLEQYQRELMKHMAQMRAENDEYEAKNKELLNVIAVKERTMKGLQQEKDEIAHLRSSIQGAA